MDISQLKTIPGSEAGHQFLVIGEDPEKGFIGGIRFWLNGHPYSHSTEVCFRFRLVRDENAPPVADFGHTITSAYPSVGFSGGSSKHGSVTGSIRAKLNITKVEQIVPSLVQAGAFGVIYDGLKESFPTMRFALNRDEFVQFFAAEIEKVAHEVKSHFPGVKETDDPGIDVFLHFAKKPDAAVPPNEANGEGAQVLSLPSFQGSTDAEPDPEEGDDHEHEDITPEVNPEVQQMIEAKPEGMSTEQATDIAGGDMSPDALKKAEGSLSEFTQSQDEKAIKAAGGEIVVEVATPTKKNPKKKASLKLMSGSKGEPKTS